MFSKTAFVLVAFTLSTATTSTSFVNAESPLATSPAKIQFDVPSILNCREVTTEEFANTHSLEKLLEVRIRVSSLVENGSDQQIQELFFLAYSPEKSIRIVDFSPTTSVLTEYAAPIDMTENRENSNNAGLNFSPTIELAGKASVTANMSDRNGKTRKVSKLPPKKLVVASGTQSRQSAAYFKFKPNSQSTLEGSQEISLTIQVPIAWRADILHIHCRGLTAGGSKGSQVRQSRNDFVVPIYIENDAVAKLKCDEYRRAESNFRQLGSKEKVQSVSGTSNKNDLVSKVGKFLRTTVSKPKPKSGLSPNWMGSVIFAKTYQKFDSHISTNSRKAIRQLAKSRQELIAMRN